MNVQSFCLSLPPGGSEQSPERCLLAGVWGEVSLRGPPDSGLKGMTCRGVG